ncbi:TVP38/TMEM64 family membrane protein [Thalictrum thalictroides]|uniref:TVP38/TMEM64 family membrane protein n=1 Tax=Thalictrum thalictroides TaxID=46969 RepID=A0A7J6VNY0_THATH|nr:TVP38/TMEM64 family membrane protein [Thalictrum thalictroides]
MRNSRQIWTVAIIIAVLAILKSLSNKYGFEKDEIIQIFRDLSDRLGFWAIPIYVLIHTVTLALCLPYAVFFEAGASLLFGFFPAVICVFCAKILGASLSFGIGRLVFRSSSSTMAWIQNNKYFHILAKGVERDGWKFVLLARFSPMPSYIINYGLAATKVGFLVDFLLPSVIGCLPMIIQNTSIGSLAGAAVASASGSQKSQVLSYLFPLLGIVSSILISLRIKKYSSELAMDEQASGNHNNDTVDSSQDSSRERESEGLRKRQ